MTTTLQEPVAPHLCVQCGRIRATCCQISEVYVSPMDLIRMRAFLGRDDFCEFKAPTDMGYYEQDDDPSWQAMVFRPDLTRRVLKRRPNGDCSFLAPAGCVLPMEVRPLVCRLYPYKYNDKGIQGVDLRCPTELLGGKLNVLAALDMEDLATAKRWRDMLYEEIRLEHHLPSSKPVASRDQPPA